MTLLLRCIFRNEQGDAVHRKVRPEDRALRLVAEGALAAAVSTSSGPCNPSDLHSAAAHARIVQALHHVATVLPVRYGACFRTRQEIRRLLRTHQSQFLESLRELDGCEEMSIRVLSARRPFSRTESMPAPVAARVRMSASSCGASYLAWRRKLYQARDARRDHLRQAARRIEHAFEGLFIQSNSERSSSPGAAEGVDMISVHFLVRRDEAEKFRREFCRAGPALAGRLLLTGPWPLYHFSRNVGSFFNRT